MGLYGLKENKIILYALFLAAVLLLSSCSAKPETPAGQAEINPSVSFEIPSQSDTAQQNEKSSVPIPPEFPS